jgi:hypothetical protein
MLHYPYCLRGAGTAAPDGALHSALSGRLVDVGHYGDMVDSLSSRAFKVIICKEDAYCMHVWRPKPPKQQT